ncbi:MAG: DUF2513 domain-containing protein [Gammaproteobacteria bacterium]|nr:DUF2513 domain-containing protein [Gammaproteobacteria bacterium]
MKRDHDYLRDLLFEIENQEDNLLIMDLSSERKRWHHVELLCDCGYMTQISDTGFRLTSQGHDFIDSIRDEGIWSNTKAMVAETGGNATLEIIKNLASGFLKKKISDHTGMEL